MPILDTNFLIRLARKDPKAAEAYENLRSQHLVVPVQAALEYLTGLEGTISQGLQWLEDAFLLAHTDDGTLAKAAKLRAKQVGAGRRVRTADLWIAAHAIDLETYVVTTNKRHFRALGVPAWNYEKEPMPPAGAP